MNKFIGLALSVGSLLFSAPVMAQVASNPSSGNNNSAFSPTMFSAPMASYGMGGGVFCPSPAVSASLFGSDQNFKESGSENYGAMVGVSFPLGGTKKEACERASRAQLSLMKAQEKYYRSLVPALVKVVD